MNLRRVEQPSHLGLSRGVTLLVGCALALIGCSGGPPRVTPAPSNGQPPAQTMAAPRASALASTDEPGVFSPAPSGPATGPGGSTEPVTVSVIKFGRDVTATSSIVTVVNAGDRFKPGREIAWRVQLPPAVGSETLFVEVVNDSGTVVFEGQHSPTAGSNIFYGKDVLAADPGDYVMRYILDGVVIAEGRFRLRGNAVAEPDPTPAPERTAKPTAKPTAEPTSDRQCDSSYPDVCIPPYPPDLDCGDIPFTDFRVTGLDRHGFDGDDDGWGCES